MSGSLVSSTPPPACRVYAILARGAPVAVVFVRHPAAAAFLQVLWHTDSDRFVVGQWAHGQVYPEKCDISPDGSLIAYFAGATRGRPRTHAVQDAWTCISHPPYFSPLAVFPQFGTSHGGGLFVDNETVELGTRQSDCGHHPAYPPTGIAVRRLPAGMSIEASRLNRDGWTLAGRHRVRLSPDQSERLHCEAHAGRGSSYQLEVRGRMTRMDGTDWADYDQRGRLVYSKWGALWARTAGGQHRQLADFRGLRYRSASPPAGALRW